MSKKSLIIIAILVLIIIGQSIYFNLNKEKQNEEKQKKESQENEFQFADGDVSASTRILINTSENNLTVGNESFITDEWKHVSEKWFEKNVEELKKYPEIKEARIILEEKLEKIIKENNLQGFAQGLKDTAEQYKQKVPSIASFILKITANEKAQENTN